ncbi:MAG: hypothetical protein HOO06_10645 [Bdellovibrionaceae bacterium]|jgi:uncharacterized metal-binding protein YceD (DUF177 family)|nr:hypothetical protein [Pseudobdellovibrionaceae bacterium]
MNKINITILALNEVPLEGEKFTYTRASGELNEALSDLIKDADYTVTLEVFPFDADAGYQLRGEVHTEMPLSCSRCAIDFSYKVNCKINEVAFVGQEFEVKGDQSVKTPHFSQHHKTDDPETLFLDRPELNIGEYIHEVIALNEPMAPLGRPDCNEDCPNLQEAYKKGWIQKPEPEDKKGPFDVLKKMSLNH